MLFHIVKTLSSLLIFRSRAPNADLPNTAAFLGGLVAQEVIKMITHQYVPINGICVVDLIETWTAVLV
jgi:NEDD8-activating enzyme E1 regulatory subunit